MRLWLLAGCAVLLSWIAGVTVAAAVEPVSHEKKGEITVGFPYAEPLKDACGVAVDPTGLIFVANYYEHAVYVFRPNRKFMTRIEIDEPPLAPNKDAANGPCDLAIDSAGNLYVNRWHYDVLRFARLDPSSPSFGPPVVIDPHGSTSVTVGDLDHVFVDDRTYVAEYDSSGAPVLEGSEPVRIGLGSLVNGYGVAVSGFTGNADFPSTAGRVYVADGADNTVKVFEPADPSTPVEVIDGGGTPQLGFSRLVDSDVAVDPFDGHLYVVDNLQPFFEEPEAVADEFSSLGHYRASIPSAVAGGGVSEVIDGEPSAVAIVEHDVYMTSGNYFNDHDEPEHPDSKVLIFGPTVDIETRILSASRTGAGDGTVFSSSRAGLGCGSACEGEFKLDSEVVLTAVPAAHSRFAGWTGCTPRAEAPEQCLVEMNEDRAVSAEFEPIPPQHLSVLRSFVDGGDGTVRSGPAGIDCGATCDADFDQGSEVSLTASPSSGSRFDHWSGCDSEPRPGECRVTMNAARQVEAVFARVPEPPPSPPVAPAQRILSVLVTGSGAATGTVTSDPAGIDCGGTCARSYRDGTTVTLVAHPAPGSRLLGWGGCAGAGDRCTVALGADRTAVAAFGPASPGRLKPRGAVGRGAAATLRLSIPAAGALSASGPGLRPASALPLAAGRTSLKLRLNAAGRRKLARAGRLAVKVTLLLEPFDGGDNVHARTTVVFRTKR